MSALNPDQFELVRSLVQKIMAMRDCDAFHDPVDWEDDSELKDYPNVVKQPMDFNTILKNVNDGKYQTFEECFLDLSLIWENCKAFNYSPEIYKLA